MNAARHRPGPDVVGKEKEKEGWEQDLIESGSCWEVISISPPLQIERQSKTSQKQVQAYNVT